MLVIGLLLIACWLVYKYCAEPMYYWKKRNVLQANPYPLVGDSLGSFLRYESAYHMFERLYNFTTKRYLGIYQMTKPMLMLRDPELIKQITVKDFDHFTDHRNFTPDTDPLWNHNLFALKGDRWRDMRSTLSPAFTGHKMKAMFELMNKCGEQCIEYFEGKNKDSIEVEMKGITTRFANDVIATCAFGIKCDSLKDPDNEFYLMGKDATNFRSFWRNLKIFIYILSPTLAKILNVQLFTKEVGNFFRNLVGDTVKYREDNNIVRPDMINLLMEARKGRLKYEAETNEKDAGFATVEESYIGKAQKSQRLEITIDNMTSQALIFFFAGFETVSTAMSFLAYELAVNPEIQEKLRAEIKETYANCKGKLNYDELAKMKYMDMVISETLRKWPPAVGTDRVCVKPYTIPAKEKGEEPLSLDIDTSLWIPIVSIHRDPNYYPNPDKFDPERFSEENKDKINPFTYMPFGAGPRNCIGSRFAIMEAKTIFFHLLAHFELKVSKKTTVPLKIDTKQFNLASADGYWIELKKLA